MPAQTRIRAEKIDNIQVIRILDPRVFDEKEVRETSEQIQEALPSGQEPIHLILDFTGVEMISSGFLGKLILLLRRVENSGGKLRVCELGTNIGTVFRVSNLDRLFGIDRDRRESLDNM